MDCSTRTQIKAIYKAVLEPRVSPAFVITYFSNHCNIRFEITKYVDTLTLFSKNLNQRSLTPRWPLTPCLLRSRVWLYPRIIVSKSHDNSSMYVDTVINFAKYHIHTTYYIHTTDILCTYYVQNEWSHSLLLNSVQARQKCVPQKYTPSYHTPINPNYFMENEADLQQRLNWLSQCFVIKWRKSNFEEWEIGNLNSLIFTWTWSRLGIEEKHLKPQTEVIWPQVQFSSFNMILLEHKKMCHSIIG